jgi:hypothetical protein
MAIAEERDDAQSYISTAVPGSAAVRVAAVHVPPRAVLHVKSAISTGRRVEPVAWRGKTLSTAVSL